VNWIKPPQDKAQWWLLVMKIMVLRFS